MSETVRGESRNLGPYKAVGFDYGGVVSGQPRSAFHADVANLFGVSVEQFLNAYYRHNKCLNNGEITRQKLWELVASNLDMPDKANDALKLSLSVINQPNNQNVLDLVETIKSKSFKVGLLSNNTIDMGRSMREQGIDKVFDVFHNSAETGLVKPDPEAFKFLADELGVQMSEMIFVDDVEKSLSTAQECGFTPILYESYEQLRNSLKELKVL